MQAEVESVEQGAANIQASNNFSNANNGLKGVSQNTKNLYNNIRSTPVSTTFVQRIAAKLGVRLPIDTGTFSKLDDEGNGLFTPNAPEARAILENTELKFVKGYPKLEKGVSPDLPEIKFSPGELTGVNSKDFAMADKRIMQHFNYSTQAEATKWRTDGNLTLHHVEDCVTLQLVNTALHSNVYHTGGASIIRCNK